MRPMLEAVGYLTQIWKSPFQSISRGSLDLKGVRLFRLPFASMSFEFLRCITDSMDTSLSRLREIMKDSSSPLQPMGRRELAMT